MLPAILALDIKISLGATPLFHIGPLAVTNSILYGVICSIFIVFMMIVAARRVKLEPVKGTFHNAIEFLVETVISMLEGAFTTWEKAAKYTPYFGVYFIFIFFTNLLELVPWVGDSVYWHGSNGLHTVLLRPFTADLNGTLAMAVIAIIMVQILSIKHQGVRRHLQHYFSDKPTNPMNFFIGLLEVFGELTRIMSLSLRLFLNTAVGDILLAVFASIILAEGRTPLAVLPIFLFEALVAFIQAYVFTVLAGTYLGLAVGHSPYEEDHHAGSPNQVEGAKT
jgi:F-type H+-transporting ATPase subunit a